MSLTNHCHVRNQQRCIPPIVHEWLSEYGVETHDGHGGIKIYFTHESIRRMERDFGRHFVRENRKYLNVYRVDSATDGCVITAGWRTRRIKTN